FGLVEWLKILKKKLHVSLMGLVLGIASSYLITSFVLTPKYSSITQLLVSRPPEAGQVISLGDIQTNIQLINTYKDIIEDPVILNQVMNASDFKEDIDDMRNMIDIEVQEDSQIFGIRVTDTDPDRAAFLANTVAGTFQKDVGSILSVKDVAILSPAEANMIPISPNLAFNLVI